MESLLIAMLVLGTVLALGLPLVRRRLFVAAEAAGLADRKLSIYQDIRDLELDRQTGKVSDADYRMMRSDYEQEAAQVMKAMDEEDSRQGKHRKRSCPSCGATLSGKDRFCGDCGHAV